VPLIRRDEAYPKGPLSADVRGEVNGADGDRGRRERGRLGQDESGQTSNGRMNDGQNGKDARNGQDRQDDGGQKRRRRKPGGLVDYDEVLPYFREATWDEALDLVARRLTEIHAAGGPGAIAGFTATG
jgi:formate dehydrogenase major subunit